MNPRAYPYLRLLVPFACGIALGAWRDVYIPGLDIVLLLGGAFAFLLASFQFPYHFRWVFGVYISVWLILAGYYHVVQHHEGRQRFHFSSFLQNGTCIIGTVYGAPSKGARVKIPVRVEAIGSSADSLQACTGNVLLFLNADSASLGLQYGDRLRISAQIRPTEAPRNPHAFDYRRYLHFQNINYQAFVKEDSFQVLSGGHGYWLWKHAYTCRNRLLDILKKHFSSEDEYAVACALLVGYTDDLSDDLRAAYAQTGSMHALAVSGTHIGMLYVGLLFLLKRFRLRGRRGKWVEATIILLLIWAFTFLTGATASVLRASVMFSAYMIGKMLYRDASAWNILAASAFGLLVYNPYFLFDAGFQLSYSAVAGMVFFYPRFYRLSPILPPWADLAWKTLLVGFAAQLGTLPLSLYYFHQFPVYFWLAGWFVVLGGAIFLWGGAVLVILDAIWPFAANCLGTALYYMLWGMNQIIFLIQQLPGSVLGGIWVNEWATLILYVSIILFGGLMVERNGKWALALLSAVSLLGIGRAIHSFDQLRQKQCVVYSIPKQRLLDFFDGDQVWTLSDTLTPKQILFAAQSNRWALGMYTQQQIYLDRDTAVAGQNFFYWPPFIQFFDQKMLLLDDARWVRSGTTAPVPVNIVLLTKNPDISIAECRLHFPAEMFVFDVTNKWKQVEQWKEECTVLGVSYYDMRENGAYISPDAGK